MTAADNDWFQWINESICFFFFVGIPSDFILAGMKMTEGRVHTLLAADLISDIRPRLFELIEKLEIPF